MRNLFAVGRSEDMLDLDVFKKIVDSTPDNVSSIRNDIGALQKYADIPSSSAFKSSDVSDKFYGTIRNSFSSDPRIIDQNHRRLRDELIFRHVLLQEEIHPYFGVLATIHDALGGSPDAPSSQDDWRQAIAAALDHLHLRSTGNMEETLSVFSRQFHVAHAARRLQEQGYKILFNDGNIYLDGSSEMLLIAKLSALVRSIGGIDVAAKIFSILKPAFDPDQDRHHLVRSYPPLGGVKEPLCPFGYLLALAVKHPFIPRHRLDVETNWRQLVELSTDYACLCDVQPYSQYEIMFKDGYSIISFLQEIVLYDAFFCMAQLRPRDAVKIVKGVLGWLGLGKALPAGWSVSDAISVAENFLKVEPFNHGPICFHLRDIAKKCAPMKLKRVSQVLKFVFSHPLSGPNQNFGKPTDVPGTDFGDRPLLALGNDNYCIIDRSVCAPAIIEAIFTPLRTLYTGFDDRLGAEIEKFLCAELKKNGVAFSQGKYVSNGEDGECDIVIETTDKIIFLEVKKKSLTRKARAGSDIDLLVDMAGSLLDAQLQAGWHEVRIRRDGFLDLYNGDAQCTRISLNGRDVERVAVTLFDYGGLQDRMLLKQFLESHLRMNFSTQNEPLKKKLEKLNIRVDALRKQTEALMLMRASQQQPFFNCWFLSVPQLLILLDNVKDNDSFKSALWDVRHIWTGSLDFYFDLSSWKKIRANAQKP